MSGFIPDPSNYTMKGNPAKTAPVAPQIDPTDDNAVRAMARKELVALLCTPGLQANTKLAVIRELLDRLDGKPAQSLNTTINGNINNTIQIVRFSDLPAQVDSPKLLPVDNSQVIEQ